MANPDTTRLSELVSDFERKCEGIRSARDLKIQNEHLVDEDRDEVEREALRKQRRAEKIFMQEGMRITFSQFYGPDGADAFCRLHAATVDEYDEEDEKQRPSLELEDKGGQSQESNKEDQAPVRCEIPEKLDIFYEPLDWKVTPIRLLILEPGEYDEPLAGRLEQYELTRQLEYDAISYSWGGERVSLGCSRSAPAPGWHTEPFSRNTLRALRDIRSPHHTMRLWIDALCIDQSNVVERERQVKLMESIYADARRVRVWLDEEVDLNLPCFKMLERYDTEWEPDGVDWEYLFKSDANQKIGGHPFYLGDDPTMWDPLCKIMRNAYWKRVWVQQELILSHLLVLHCGKSLLCGQSILAFQVAILGRSRFLRERHRTFEQKVFQQQWLEPLEDIASLSTPSKSVVDYQWAHRTPPEKVSDIGPHEFIRPGTLLYIILRYRDLQVTDPRDRVYGFLGLAIDRDEFEVNYGLTVAQCYAAALRDFIKIYWHVAFLAYVCCPYGFIEMNGESVSVPSWVPDWTREQAQIFRPELYRASLGYVAMENPVDVENGTLKARGVLVTTVKMQFPPIDSNPRRAMDIFKVLDKFAGGDLTRKEQWLITLMHPYIDLHRREYTNFRDLRLPGSHESIVQALVTTFNEFRRRLSEFEFQDQNSLDLKTKLLRAVEDGSLGDQGFEKEIVDAYTALCDSTLLSGSVALLNPNPTRTKNGVTILPEYIGITEDLTIYENYNKYDPMPDEVWIIMGCPMPMLLRPTGHGFYLVIAPIHIAGLMEGEVVENIDFDAESAPWQPVPSRPGLLESKIETITLR